MAWAGGACVKSASLDRKSPAVPQDSGPLPATVVTPNPVTRAILLDDGTAFRATNRFELHRVVGKGAYGIVVSALDLVLNRRVAIKKISCVNANATYTKRTLRELRIMRLLGRHDNLVSLRHILQPSETEESSSAGIPDSMYIVLDLMDTNLSDVIKSTQTLNSDHIQFFIYQVLRGLLFLHSNNIIHRDIKPRNLLVNSNCELRICDFGLARYVPDRVNQVAPRGEALTRRSSPAFLGLTEGINEESVAEMKYGVESEGRRDNATAGSGGESKGGASLDSTEAFALGMDSLHFEESKRTHSSSANVTIQGRKVGGSASLGGGGAATTVDGASESKEAKDAVRTVSRGRGRGGDEYASTTVDPDSESGPASKETAHGLLPLDTELSSSPILIPGVSELQQDLTEYVQSRWYRAPEVIVGLDGHYNNAVDVWGVGCVLGEMMMRRPLFPGENSVEQIKFICETVGIPEKKVFFRVTKSDFRRQLMSLALSNRSDRSDAMPSLPRLLESKGYTGRALDMLERTLSFDPKRRPNVTELLSHPFLERWHNENDEEAGTGLPSSEFEFDHGREKRPAQFHGEIQKELDASAAAEERRAQRRAQRDREAK